MALVFPSSFAALRLFVRKGHAVSMPGVHLVFLVLLLLHGINRGPLCLVCLVACKEVCAPISKHGIHLLRMLLLSLPFELVCNGPARGMNVRGDVLCSSRPLFFTGADLLPIQSLLTCGPVVVASLLLSMCSLRPRTSVPATWADMLSRLRVHSVRSF